MVCDHLIAESAAMKNINDIIAELPIERQETIAAREMSLRERIEMELLTIEIDREVARILADRQK